MSKYNIGDKIIITHDITNKPINDNTQHTIANVTSGGCLIDSGVFIPFERLELVAPFPQSLVGKWVQCIWGGIGSKAMELKYGDYGLVTKVDNVLNEVNLVRIGGVNGYFTLSNDPVCFDFDHPLDYHPDEVAFQSKPEEEETKVETQTQTKSSYDPEKCYKTKKYKSAQDVDEGDVVVLLRVDSDDVQSGLTIGAIGVVAEKQNMCPYVDFNIGTWSVALRQIRKLVEVK
jgi:hypothetical protein